MYLSAHKLPMGDGGLSLGQRLLPCIETDNP